jgi:ATP-dependent Lhr-like helicase
MQLTPPRAQGRWSLVADLQPVIPAPTPRATALCEVLLRRHGVLVREAVAPEPFTGGFTGIYPVLRAMEERGHIRRGHFVEGLGGIQFAVPGAVDQLRAQRDRTGGPPLLLAATDPANPFGSLLPWPELSGRPSRAAGAWVVVRDGLLRVHVERGAHTLLCAADAGISDLEPLVQLAANAGGMEIRQIDGVAAAQHSLAPLLRELGFGTGVRGLVLRPRRPLPMHA